MLAVCGITFNRILFRNKESYIKRKLFTKETLGITAYEQNREQELSYTKRLTESKKEFRYNLDQTVPLNLIIDGLKRFIHIMDSTNDDLFLLRKGLRLYHTQTVQQKTKSPDEKKDQFYTFGPIVMRAFYYLDIPDIAIEFFEDAQIGSLFNQMATYQILLDLLYDKREYGTLLRLYKDIEQRIQERDSYPSNAITSIIFATYFQLRTKKHRQCAFQLYEQLNDIGQWKHQFRKSIAMVAEMKRKENESNESLKILAPYDDIDVNIRFVRIAANLDLNKFNEVFRLVRMTSDAIAMPDKSPVPKIPNELLQMIENKMDTVDDDSWKEEFRDITNRLKQTDRIMYRSYHEALCNRLPTKMRPYITGKTKSIKRNTSK